MPVHGISAVLVPVPLIAGTLALVRLRILGGHEGYGLRRSPDHARGRLQHLRRASGSSVSMAKALRLSLTATIFVTALVLSWAGAQTSLQPWMGKPGPTYGLAEGNPEQGRHVAETACAACHGTNGNSTDPRYPKLAGQNPAYLYWQLWAFKRGTRRSEVMSGIVARLSDADMADAASFYSRQVRKPDAVKDPPLAAIGERIFFAGMPACAMCHGAPGQRGMPMTGGMMGGMNMMGRGMMGPGMMANAPLLDGQHAAYILDQLNRFASGERPATIMNRIAATLSERNRKAVAEYLSGLP